MIACVSTSVAAAALVFALLAFTVASSLVARRRPPRPDAGRPVQPTSPMWPKPTARPEPGTRPTGSPSIAVNDLTGAPVDLRRYVGGPPVAPVRSSLIERPDW